MGKLRIAVAVGGKRNDVMYQTISGIRRKADEVGADVFVFCCYGGSAEDRIYDDGEYNIFTLISQEDYDGFIMVSRNIDSDHQRQQLAEYLKESHKPAVSIENDVDGMYFAGIDNYRAVYEMTSHLIEEHHCHTLNFIGGPDFDYENKERCHGFRQACLDHAIIPEEKRIRQYSWSYTDGTAAYWDLKDSGLLNADAYVCANDDLAIGFISALQAGGYRVPEDCLVTGFDRSTNANVFSPHLTTVDREKETAGYKACDLLLKAISGASIPRRTILQSRCIYAASCGCHDDDTVRIMEDSCKTAVSVLAKDMLSSKLNIMGTALSKCTDLESYNHALAEFVEMLHTPAFYLMINQSELNNAPEIDAPYRSRGYDELMYVGLEVKKGRASANHGRQIPSRSIVPEQDSQKNHMYLISPIHFQDRCMGFCVTVDSLYLVHEDRYFDWLNNINVTLNILHEKRMLKILNDKLNTLYMEDAATGLYNRFGYSMKAIDLFRENEVHGDSTLVMFLDINNLKKINDQYGHHQGDVTIQVMAQAIRACIPEDYIPVRYGGDEFLIIGKCMNEQQVEELLSDIQRYLAHYNETSGKVYDVSVSIGYVIAEPSSAISIDSYVEQADACMYEAKQKFKQKIE